MTWIERVLSREAGVELVLLSAQPPPARGEKAAGHVLLLLVRAPPRVHATLRVLYRAHLRTHTHTFIYGPTAYFNIGNVLFSFLKCIKYKLWAGFEPKPPTLCQK